MKVLHVITNLRQGGAEVVLYRLISASPDIEHVVVSLMGYAYYGHLLLARGVQVHTLDMTRWGWGTLRAVLKLRKIVTKVRPDVVQTWMYHADLVGGLVARWVSIRSIVWGVRQSNLDADKCSFSARATARICAFLSRWIPFAIACCSAQATRVHQAIGYRAKKFVVIPNGYDLSYFLPDVEIRNRVRMEWGIGSEVPLLGMVARWDPQKDHYNLLSSLVLLKDWGVNFRCVLVGSGMDCDNATLLALIGRLALSDRIILAGPREDIPAVMNALDLHVLSSAGEAFPNAVAEAMACGTPCVVTDVGDSAMIVGDTGWVVPSQNAEALARGVEKALMVLATNCCSGLGSDCRARIEEKFSLEKMVLAYRELWFRVAAK